MKDDENEFYSDREQVIFTPKIPHCQNHHRRSLDPGGDFGISPDSWILDDSPRCIGVVL